MCRSINTRWGVVKASATQCHGYARQSQHRHSGLSQNSVCSGFQSLFACSAQRIELLVIRAWTLWYLSLIGANQEALPWCEFARAQACYVRTHPVRRRGIARRKFVSAYLHAITCKLSASAINAIERCSIKKTVTEFARWCLMFEANSMKKFHAITVDLVLNKVTKKKQTQR